MNCRRLIVTGRKWTLLALNFLDITEESYTKSQRAYLVIGSMFERRIKYNRILKINHE
jgi:hypothetical protein